jgi:hypothetical protein
MFPAIISYSGEGRIESIGISPQNFRCSYSCVSYLRHGNVCHIVHSFRNEHMSICPILRVCHSLAAPHIATVICCSDAYPANPIETQMIARPSVFVHQIGADDVMQAIADEAPMWVRYR